MKQALSLFRRTRHSFFNACCRRAAFVILLCGCLSSVASAQMTEQWDKRYGGRSEDQIRDIIATPDGGYLLAGSGVPIVFGRNVSLSIYS